MNSSNLHDFGGHLAKNWEGIPDTASNDDLKSWLKERILHLLREDFEKLVNAMYRLDVREDKFKVALGSNGEGAIADAITELVWERELQRFETRRKYSRKPPTEEK